MKIRLQIVIFGICFLNFSSMINVLIAIWTFWAFFITILIFLLLFPFNFILIFLFGHIGRKIFMSYTYYLGNILIFFYGMKKEISGCYPFQHNGPCVYVVNHKSYLDVIIIASLINQKIKYLGKAEVFKWPLFGMLAKYSGQIPVQRENKDSREKSYELMKNAIADGFSIILFPEGGWKNKGDNKSLNPYNLKDNKFLHEFRNGAFRLAIETQVPVVPIALFNAQERFSDAKMKVVPGKIKAHVFNQIDTSNITDSFSLNNQCYNLMIEEIKKYHSL